MKTTLPKLLTVIGLLALVTTAAASADEGALNLRASLSGFNEVPPKATAAIGTLKAKAANGGIDFTLTYSGLTTPAFMAHFHFAQAGVNSSIFIWLCGLPGTPAHQVCPARTLVQGTWRPHFGSSRPETRTSTSTRRSSQAAKSGGRLALEIRVTTDSRQKITS